MDSSRRHFLKIAGTAALTSLPGLSSAWEELLTSYYTGHVAVNQHMTNETSAQFSVLTPGKLPYAYRVFDPHGKELPVEMYDHDKLKSYGWGIDKLIVRNLQSDTKYRLRIIDKDRGTVIDERFFKNLILNRASAKFALISCACDAYFFQNKNMWHRLFDDRPEVIMLLGDACYADLGTDGSEFDIWRRYCETRRTLSHFKQSNLVPTLAVWDDHDYGQDNADRYYKNKKMAKRCFELFFGSREVTGYKKTVGVGSVFTGFGQRFFFMDDRTFRDPKNTSGGMMWGGEQQEMVLDLISKSSKPTWIMNGSQFFGNYMTDESFQKNFFKNLVDVTRKLSKMEAPVLFASGDIHFSEVMRIEPRVLGYKTFEFTSSAMHSFNFPTTWFLKNPRRVAHTWKHNFVMMHSKVIKGGLKTSCYATGRFGRNLFYHEGSVIR
ncbi:phosphodiesterase [Bdellovibrio sp. 22V]|uniref:phosphodiesterase n=1 Tax=Bdellovibrio TaxID=958 RepID=UPI002542B10C|nr:phosphodiesterase [Bdellovibrio sp. 22V]WII73299.1 phosphodiesterase [Bdellovibrio sp. 22V]